MEKIKTIVLSKKSLYTICFMLLNLIEFLWATQDGDVWYVSTNCMGLVVMVMIVSAYPMKDFFTVGNGIYTVLCAAAMAAAYYLRRQDIVWFHLGQVESAILNVWWIGIMARYLFRKVVTEKSLPFKPRLAGWLWVLMSVLMTASVSERWWPLWFLLMFGCFYLTRYTKEDRTALWDSMVDGTILSFFCMQIYAYGFRPYDDVRYSGPYFNCNMTALYYLIVYLMCLFKLHILELRKGAKGWKLFYLVGAGGMLSFQLFTIGRTAWVTSFVVTALYGILVVRKIWQKKWRQVLVRGFALVLSLLFTFLPVYYSIRWLPTILHHPVWYISEYSENKVHSFDPPDSEKYIELDEFLEAMWGRIADMLGVEARSPRVIHVLAAGLDAAEDVVDDIDKDWGEDFQASQGEEETEASVAEELPSAPGFRAHSMRVRLAILEQYFKDMTWYGNKPDSGQYDIEGSSFTSWHAQNLWVQIAYYYGIPSGILMAALTFVLLYQGMKLALTEKTNPYAIFPIFICAVCFLYGLTEVVWVPGQLIMFMMFFVQHPQIREKEAEQPAC